LVGCLIGITVSGMMSEQLQQLIQQPDAPNLYWALSTLPHPLVDIRLGVEAETSFLVLQFPELHGLDKKNLSPDEWRALLTRFLTNCQDIVNYSMDQHASLSKEALTAMVAASTLQAYPQAKRHLIDLGRSAAEVEAMPVAQVVLLYTVQVYNELSEEQAKWMLLPFSEIGAGFNQAQQRISDEFAANREIIPIGRFFLPAIMTVKHSETRCEWILAKMRIFEALRLYAAAHDGRWPDRLTDITEVPIPLNPIDGKPFVYKREGNKAILTCEIGPRNIPWRYEITLMPKSK
jgi:hypothetical protein